jgi:hypothetical protein
MIIETEQGFRTNHTPLAAFLISEGFVVVIIEYDDTNHGVYVFDSDPNIKDLGKYSMTTRRSVRWL